MSVLSDFKRPISITFSSLTVTSVTISWTQPPLSLPMDEYRVELRRVTDARQLCTMVEDYKSKMTTGISTVEFTNLQEFSIYNVTINTDIMLSPMRFNVTLMPTVEFTTKAFGMYDHTLKLHMLIIMLIVCSSTYCSPTQSKHSLYHLQKC